ncbi:DUF6527 family protein [Palleronia sp.]|uniref:DUF6527 family protein n=1 Tax=Palleronia sp. TaxID=1940284 RepID=UPI0035C8150A
MAFRCPGCKSMHCVIVEGTGRPRWSYNGDADAPTFSPSIHVSAPDPDAPRVELARCHSFVREGQIRFLADSTHNLAGQTVELPDLPELN